MPSAGDYAPIIWSDAPAAGNTGEHAVPASPSIDVPSASNRPLQPVCDGAFQQGGLAVCRTRPGAVVVIGDHQTIADAQGFVVFGFDWGAPAQETILFRAAEDSASLTFAIAPRAFRTSRIDGVPQNTVTPNAEAQERIARDRVLINRGYASLAARAGFLDGFVWPVEGRISSAWGAQRIINGTPARPHYGIDIAQPSGTPIRAPAGGVVSLAAPDLHQEGGLVMIDHGQGLISLYLHMSRIDVADGQVVAQGDVIGAVGATGRATGAHLCWRLKWRDRFLDPSLAIPALAQARRTLATTP
jgi:murein DD-endopeptidase MepM/ murein hydrolase activator NlpD